MNSTFNTYKSTFEILATKLQQDILQANTTGKTEISQEDLQTLFYLINSHADSTCMLGWEALKKNIDSEIASSSKSTRSRKK